MAVPDLLKAALSCRRHHPRVTGVEVPARGRYPHRLPHVRTWVKGRRLPCVPRSTHSAMFILDLGFILRLTYTKSYQNIAGAVKIISMMQYIFNPSQNPFFPSAAVLHYLLWPGLCRGWIRPTHEAETGCILSRAGHTAKEGAGEGARAAPHTAGPQDEHTQPL